MYNAIIINFYDFVSSRLGLAAVQICSALSKSTAPSFTERSMFWVSADSLFLREVRMRFWALKPLSQSAVCSGHVMAKAASLSRLGNSCEW